MLGIAALLRKDETGYRNGIRLYTRLERLWLALGTLTTCGTSHNWSFPFTSREPEWRMIYAANPPYNAHQQCPHCGTMRLWDTDKWKDGPMFHKELK